MKDLGLVVSKDNPIKDIIIVDNSFDGVVQYQNLVPITSFYGSKEDTEL